MEIQHIYYHQAQLLLEKALSLICQKKNGNPHFNKTLLSDKADSLILKSLLNKEQFICDLLFSLCFFQETLNLNLFIILYQLVRIMTRKIGFACLFILPLIMVSSVKLEINQVSSQYVPIPKRYPGLFIGEPSAPITIELVYDPTCDDSAGFDHTIQDFVKALDQGTLSQINFKFALNVLPYHISSFKLAMAVRYVYNQKGSQQALRILRYFLDNIQSWDEAAIKKVTINQYLNNIANKVSSLTAIRPDQIRKQLAHYSDTDGQTRQWAKYVMGSLRIPGTPQMLVNGVRVDGGVNMNVAQLTTLVKSLL